MEIMHQIESGRTSIEMKKGGEFTRFEKTGISSDRTASSGFTSAEYQPC